jgi:hypothetical protein
MAVVMNQSAAIRKCDEEARKTGKKKMVVYNHNTGKFSVKGRGKYSVNEEAVYYSR